MARPLDRKETTGGTKLTPVLTSGVAWIGAALSSLCCLLPVAVILLGLGGGAFMAVTMQYRWFLIPAGVLGVTVGFVLYTREARRCTQAGCRMAGSRIALVLLVGATVVVIAAIMLDRFPQASSGLLSWATARSGSGTTMDRMR